MLTEDSGSVLSRVAEPAKQKAMPPPVARKPVGLMERILAGKKTDESGEPLNSIPQLF